MEPTINSMHYLWAAYLVVAGSNIAVVIWLAARWSAVNRKQS
ncbi:MAG TPA: hypothetical protein VIM67_13225 [Terriglobus sp.]